MWVALGRVGLKNLSFPDARVIGTQVLKILVLMMRLLLLFALCFGGAMSASQKGDQTMSKVVLQPMA